MMEKGRCCNDDAIHGSEPLTIIGYGRSIQLVLNELARRVGRVCDSDQFACWIGCRKFGMDSSEMATTDHSNSWLRSNENVRIVAHDFALLPYAAAAEEEEERRSRPRPCRPSCDSSINAKRISNSGDRTPLTCRISLACFTPTLERYKSL